LSESRERHHEITGGAIASRLASVVNRTGFARSRARFKVAMGTLRRIATVAWFASYRCVSVSKRSALPAQLHPRSKRQKHGKASQRPL